MWGGEVPIGTVVTMNGAVGKISAVQTKVGKYSKKLEYKVFWKNPKRQQTHNKWYDAWHLRDVVDTLKRHRSRVDELHDSIGKRECEISRLASILEAAASFGD